MNKIFLFFLLSLSLIFPKVTLAQWQTYTAFTSQTEAVSFCLANTNKDQKVDAADAVTVLEKFNQSCQGCAEDVNQDKRVNAADFVPVLQSFGKSLKSGTWENTCSSLVDQEPSLGVGPAGATDLTFYPIEETIGANDGAIVVKKDPLTIVHFQNNEVIVKEYNYNPSVFPFWTEVYRGIRSSGWQYARPINDYVGVAYRSESGKPAAVYYAVGSWHQLELNYLADGPVSSAYSDTQGLIFSYSRSGGLYNMSQSWTEEFLRFEYPTVRPWSSPAIDFGTVALNYGGGNIVYQERFYMAYKREYGTAAEQILRSSNEITGNPRGSISTNSQWYGMAEPDGLLPRDVSNPPLMSIVIGVSDTLFTTHNNGYYSINGIKWSGNIYNNPSMGIDWRGTGQMAIGMGRQVYSGGYIYPTFLFKDNSSNVYYRYLFNDTNGASDILITNATDIYSLFGEVISGTETSVNIGVVKRDNKLFAVWIGDNAPPAPPLVQPTTLSNVHISDIRETEIEISWDDVDYEENYEIYKMIVWPDTWELVDSVGANVTSYRLTNLACETRLLNSYKIRARNWIGSNEAILPGYPPQTAPCHPTNLNVVEAVADHVRLQWYDEDPVNQGYDWGFRIERKLDSENWTDTSVVVQDYFLPSGGGDITWDDTNNIQIGATYNYRVLSYGWGSCGDCGFNAAVYSNYSNIVSATPGSGGASPSPSPSRTPTPTTVSSPTPTPCPGKTKGNANGDCYINNADYTIWLCEYLNNGVCPNPASNKQADFNSDSKVDLIDFEIWRTNKQ